MKLVSFTVPCYNSQEYMSKCVDSLLVGGDDVEIIIVNDGSKDATLQIAQAYAIQFPNIVKVIDKPNGGHGSGVNAGLKAATGLYFKVVDSDDWLDTDALKTLIATVKAHLAADELPDLYITNFVYDRLADNEQYVSAYGKKMPQGEIIGWEKIKRFRFSHMLLMHSLMYKRDKLLESNTVLPEHTFYVDNLFAYKPLPYMQTICYLNVDLYHYYIGRADQSITLANSFARYKQQILVMRELVDSYSWQEIKAMPTGLKKYMWHALEAIMIVTLFFTCGDYSEERKRDLKELWCYIKSHDRQLYRKLRHFSYSTPTNLLPWRVRGWVLKKGHAIMCKRVKLG